MWYSWPTISRFSKPVRFSSTAAYWPARPIFARSAAASFTTSRPATRAEPAVGLEQRGEDPDGGGLAGPVGSEQAEDGPCARGEVDAAQGADRSVRLLEALDDDRIISHKTPS